MRLSIPIMLQTGVNSIGFLILQRLINSFGAPSIEGYAAMLKVEQLAHIPSQSFNVAISSFAGQNIGAIVLPLMLFHQIQLMACAVIAQRYATRAKAIEATVTA